MTENFNIASPPCWCGGRCASAVLHEGKWHSLCREHSAKNEPEYVTREDGTVARMWGKTIREAQFGPE